MNDDLKPCFSGETMLMGWGESDVQGPWIKLRLLDAAALNAFRGMTKARGDRAGQRLACVLVEIQDDETPAAPRQLPTAADVRGILADQPPNILAQKLHRDGYFRSGRLWERMEAMGFYTQAAHKMWIQAQGCMFEKEREVRHGPCSGDIVLHHCKSAATTAAGKGEHPQKPPHWYGVPLCAIGHHQNWVHGSGSHIATREDKQALLEKAVALTAERMKFAMKRWLQIASLREITPAMLADFERAIGL